MPSPTAPGRQGRAARLRAARLGCTHLLHSGVRTGILHFKSFVLRPGGGRAERRVPAVPAQGRPLRGGLGGGFGAQRPWVVVGFCVVFFFISFHHLRIASEINAHVRVSLRLQCEERYFSCIPVLAVNKPVCL